MYTITKKNFITKIIVKNQVIKEKMALVFFFL